MNEKVCVGLSHCRQHIEKESNTAVHVQLAFVAIPVDSHAVHILEDQIRLAASRHSGIKQLGDVRVGKPAYDAALAFESFLRRRAGESDAHELDGGAALESAVAAFGQPYDTHPSLPNSRNQ